MSTVRRRRFRRRMNRKLGRRKPITSSLIKRIMLEQAESKYHDINLNGGTTPVLSTGQVVHLTHIGEGAGPTERLGNRIEVASLQIKMIIRGDNTAPHDSVARVILFSAKDVNGALPTIANQLLEADLVYRLRDVQHYPDFNVFLDKTFILPQRESIANTVVPQRSFEYYKKWKNGHKVSYNGDAGDITESQTGHLFMALVVDNAAGDQPIWYYSIRVRFKDL